MAVSRYVTVHLSNGDLIGSGNSIHKSNEKTKYVFYPGDAVLVEPCNPLKKTHRGRTGKIAGTARERTGTIRINCDDGTWLYTAASDLVPFIKGTGN